MNWLITLPVVLPLVTASVMLLLWRHWHVQRWLSIVSMAGMVIVGTLLVAAVHRDGIQAMQMAGYDAPFGITFVADLFSAIMVFAASVMGVFVSIYSLADIRARRQAFGYHPLLHLLLMGVCGAFLTGDMFNLYVFFEIMLMASFVLLTLGGERGQMEGAIKYVTLNLISSAFFLAGVGILYGMTGTLNMAHLAIVAPQLDPHLLTALSMLFIVAFGVKAAMFPLFFWLPASYHTPPPAVSAIFAALLTKVGVYSLMRVFTLIFVHEPGVTHTIILVAAGFGMVCGVLGAAAQNEFRRILAFHSVSQIGYMLMGLGLFAVLATSDTESSRLLVQTALAGTIIFIVHHLFVKPNLFLISGVVERISGTGKLKDLGGYYVAMPALSIMFLISAMSLAGIPPLSGFWAKFILVRASLGLEFYIVAAAALFTGLWTLFSMVKIWAAVFWTPAPQEKQMPMRGPEQRALQLMIVPVGVLAGVIVIFGLAAGPIYDLSMQAAKQLMEPAMYIEAVMPNQMTEVLEVTGDGGITP